MPMFSVAPSMAWRRRRSSVRVGASTHGPQPDLNVTMRRAQRPSVNVRVVLRVSISSCAFGRAPLGSRSHASANMVTDTIAMMTVASTLAIAALVARRTAA